MAHIQESIGSSPIGATGEALGGSAPGRPAGGSPIIAIAFHWDCWLCPESRWAFPHYESCLAELASRFRTIGHAHPRAFDRLAPLYAAAGIESRADFGEVLEEADIYVCDNSSTLYEFAATDKPVLCLNAPWYRRHVEHGLRFWSYVPGLQVNGPEELGERLTEALSDGQEARDIRERAVGRAYAALDGGAAARAADAIRLLEAPEMQEAKTNPKAPRTRKVAGQAVPEPLFPEKRLRRLGAKEAELLEARTRWIELDRQGQEEAFAEMAAMTDAEIRGALEEMRADAIAGVPGGA